MSDLDLDLAALVARIQRPSDQARTAARGICRGRGFLDDLAVWLAGAQDRCPPRVPGDVHALLVVAEHGISALGVSVPGAATAAQSAAQARAGHGDAATAAAVAGAHLHVLELPGPSGRLDHDDALSRTAAAVAVSTGIEFVEERVDAGADLFVVGCASPGATTAAAVLIGVLTRSDAASVTGRGSGAIDDATWMRKCAAVRDGMRRARPHLGDPVGLLAAAGARDLAVLTGVLLAGAARRTPVLIDGVGAAAAGLLAHRLAYRAADWWLAAQRPPEPAYSIAVDWLSLRPVLELGLRAGDGTGGLLVVPLLRVAAGVLTPAAPQ